MDWMSKLSLIECNAKWLSPLNNKTVIKIRFNPAKSNGSSLLWSYIQTHFAFILHNSNKGPQQSFTEVHNNNGLL